MRDHSEARVGSMCQIPSAEQRTGKLAVSPSSARKREERTLYDGGDVGALRQGEIRADEASPLAAVFSGMFF
jgi:hypothetical protein